MHQTLLLSALHELAHLLSQNFIWYVLLHKQENHESEQLNNLPKVTQLVGGGAKI